LSFLTYFERSPVLFSIFERALLVIFIFFDKSHTSTGTHLLLPHKEGNKAMDMLVWDDDDCAEVVMLIMAGDEDSTSTW
jgi:hypothetical protein